MTRETGMNLLTLAMIALAISIVAGLLGFTGIARGEATAAKVLFGLFLGLALLIF